MSGLKDMAKELEHSDTNKDENKKRCTKCSMYTIMQVLWDIMKESNLKIMSVEGEEFHIKRIEKVFKKSVTENLPSL